MILFSYCSINVFRHNRLLSNRSSRFRFGKRMDHEAIHLDDGKPLTLPGKSPGVFLESSAGPSGHMGDGISKCGGAAKYI